MAFDISSGSFAKHLIVTVVTVSEVQIIATYIGK